jgi:hypothetical protein
MLYHLSYSILFMYVCSCSCLFKFLYCLFSKRMKKSLYVHSVTSHCNSTHFKRISTHTFDLTYQKELSVPIRNLSEYLFYLTSFLTNYICWLFVAVTNTWEKLFKRRKTLFWGTVPLHPFMSLPLTLETLELLASALSCGVWGSILTFWLEQNNF